MKTLNIKSTILTAMVLTLIATSAQAAGGNMPWEGPLGDILTSLTGPVAKFMGVAAITITGFAIAFGEGGGGMRKLLWVVFGLSIAFSATTFFLSWFGFSGGATF